MWTNDPTPFPELNAVLSEWLKSVQSILSENFTAAYLQGSFAVGDFDAHSDVDFLVALREDLSEGQLARLNESHARIFGLPSSWAQHLEGSYIPAHTLRRRDSGSALFWYLDNGSRALVRSDHDDTLVVRWVTRERGIVLAGPDPRTLIDPVLPDDLRREVRETIRDWGGEILSNAYAIDNRWAQPFATLSYARMLHTLHTGTIESKLAGVRWAEAALDRRWADLVRRAWDDRPDPSLKVHQPADPEAVEETLAFIHYAIQPSGR